MNRGAVLALLVAGSLAAGEASRADDALLEEVVAGSRENYARITHGSATYTVTTQDMAKGSDAVSIEQHVRFDGQLHRIDSLTERRILTDQEEIEFDCTHLGTADARPDYEYSAIITAIEKPGDWVTIAAHPRKVGFDQYGCMADIIESNRANKAIAFDAEREGELIRVELRADSLGASVKSWVAPNLGYNIVKQEVWGRKMPQAASVVRESQFTRADNGAFILSRYQELRREPHEGELRDAWRTDVELKEAQLTKRPDPSAFTIEGLGLPGGARIQDRIHGKHYTFGKMAVNERNILPERPLPPDDSWRMPRVDWLPIALVALVLGTVFAGYAVWRVRG